MDIESTSKPEFSLADFSRRGFLKGASALTAAAAATTPAKAATGRVVAYVGAYTDRGKGIHMFHLGSDGSLTPWKILEGIRSPSSLAFSPDKKFLYAVNEIGNFNGTTSGSVTSMSVGTDGDLRIINVVSSQGGGPAHLSVDPSGKWVLVANYGGGSVCVLPIMGDGSLGEFTDARLLPREATYGPQPSPLAPPGSFANSGHDAPHAHQAQTDPGGNFVLVTDLATDRIYSYRLDKTAGRLNASAQPYVQAGPGAGPRHFDFHPNGRWLYSLNEEASTIDFIAYDATTGAMKINASVSSLPQGFQGTNYPSEIHVSEDGRFVYGANRLNDTIGAYSIGPDGFLTATGHYWTRGSYPRHFAIEPYGRYLYVCHSRSDNVTAFGVDRGTGRLNFTGKYTGVGNPSKIVFLAL